MSPFLIRNKVMIDKVNVLALIEEALKDKESVFLVQLKISADNRIFVDIDGDNGITIDDCIELSRYIESHLDREAEDFELNVASAGADSPLRLPRQYKKNMGRKVEVTMLDGEKLEGTLTAADDEQMTLQEAPRKKKDPMPEPEVLKYADIKVAKVVIEF